MAPKSRAVASPSGFQQRKRNKQAEQDNFNKNPRAAENFKMSLIPKKGTVYVVDDDEAVRDSLQ